MLLNWGSRSVAKNSSLIQFVQSLFNVACAHEMRRPHGSMVVDDSRLTSVRRLPPTPYRKSFHEFIGLGSLSCQLVAPR